MRTPSATIGVPASTSGRAGGRGRSRGRGRGCGSACRCRSARGRRGRPAPRTWSGCAPTAVPSRTISARPRVIRAARAFSPSSSPSTRPVAMAVTFLSAPAQLDAEHVAVRVEAQGPGRPGARCRSVGDRLVRARHHQGRRPALAHLAGERRPGEHRHRPARQPIGEQLRHAQASARLEPLGRRHQHRAAAPRARATPVQHRLGRSGTAPRSARCRHRRAPRPRPRSPSPPPGRARPGR